MLLKDVYYVIKRYITNNKKEKLKVSERTTLKKYALQWYSLDLRVCDSFPYDEFRNASERINSQKGENTFSVHNTCSVFIIHVRCHFVTK